MPIIELLTEPTADPESSKQWFSFREEKAAYRKKGVYGPEARINSRIFLCNDRELVPEQLRQTNNFRSIKEGQVVGQVNGTIFRFDPKGPGQLDGWPVRQEKSTI